MFKRFLLFPLLLALLLAGTSCKGGETRQKKQLRKLRVVLDWTPNTNHAGLYVARELGYFAREGLEVEIIQPGENTAEKIVASNHADFGVSYQESVTIARTQNIPIKSIAAIIQHNTSGFASLKKSGIKSVKDFEGKSYGSSGWPSELEIVRDVMTQGGADYRKLKVVSGVYDFFSTIGKDVDFEWIYYGWDGVQAERRNIAIDYIPIRDINPVFDYYTPVLISSDMLLNSEPDLASSFLKAVTDGYEYCIANPDDAARILAKAVPDLDEEHLKLSLNYLKDEFRSDAPKWGQQKNEVWQRFADWMYQKRIIHLSVDVTDLFTNEFLP